MANDETIEQIVAEIQFLTHDILTARHEIRIAFDKIKDDAIALGRGLTEPERDARAALRATRSELGDALDDLNWVTLQRLNASENVKRLRDQLTEINEELSDDIGRLRKLEEVAATAAKVADTVAKVVGKAAALAAKV